jgi:hypothetical protein
MFCQYRSLIPLLVILSALGVSGGAVAAPCPEAGAKVFLTTTGRVTLNGRQVEASRLATALQSLKPKPSVICYSRENPEGEPHPAMTAVLEAIMSMRLPVGIFTDATFQKPVT